MGKARIIKKYRNRRLYDTKDSHYITLKDINNLVIEGESFVVEDAKTGEDLTRSSLLQIISEQEHDGEPLFSEEMLSHLIRFYNHPLQSMASKYIQQSIEFLVLQHQKLQQQFQLGVDKQDPLTKMAKLTEHNMKSWQKIQRKFFETLK